MDRYEKIALRKLVRRLCTGEKAIDYDTCLSGLRTYELIAGKFFLDKLIKNGYLQSKPTSYGTQVSLNPEKLKEIKKVLEDDFNG